MLYLQNGTLQTITEQKQASGINQYDKFSIIVHYPMHYCLKACINHLPLEMGFVATLTMIVVNSLQI